jgi:hypothetical protein
MSNKVRLTIDPDTEVDVSDTDLVDLTRWGLVVEDKSKSTEPKGSDTKKEG